MQSLKDLRDRHELINSNSSEESRHNASAAADLIFETGNASYSDNNQKLNNFIHDHSAALNPQAITIIHDCLTILPRLCLPEQIEFPVSQRDNLPGHAYARWIPPDPSPNADPHLINSWPHWAMVAEWRYLSNTPNGINIWVRVQQGDAQNTTFSFGSFSTGGDCMPAHSDRLLSMSADVKAVVFNRYKVIIFDNAGCAGAPLDSFTWEVPIRRS